jgi:2,3,4,5-tetrahydropyridine-2-carboxylate N-succinyltransferase
MSPLVLQAAIEQLAKVPSTEPLPDEASGVVDALLTALEAGIVRAAQRDAKGHWGAVHWVKRGILIGFRAGVLTDMSPREVGGPFSFIDKNTFPARAFTVEQGVRIVPGGSTIRRGTHVEAGVVCMPPMFINVGAWVGSGTMIDSHALVGSCAQVGERVHLSAGVQIGGVLEPVGASPVIIENDVIVGGNCGIYEGAVVRERAVIGAGVVLTRSTPVFDIVRQTIYRAGSETPLEIPAGAVVIPGARAISRPWAREHALSVQTPIIVKYRDGKTDAATVLEEWLR